MTALKSEYTANEIGEIMAIAPRSVRRRADREAWLCKNINANGGHQKSYIYITMPAEVRGAIAKWEAGLLPVKSAPELPVAAQTAPIPRGSLEKANAKMDLLRLYIQSVEEAPWGAKKEAKNDFLAGYNRLNGCGSHPLIYKVIGPVAYSTIESWRKKFETSGNPLMFADMRGYAAKGRTKLSPREKEILAAEYLSPCGSRKTGRTVRQARKKMKEEGISSKISDKTCERWLKQWAAQKTVHPLAVYIRKGEKAWTDECAYYDERNYDNIAVGDILVADGHTLNFETLNPKTGKEKRMTLILFEDMRSAFPLGWEIMPTENTKAISAALRRAIIRLGKIPKAVYLDNGKAFGAKYFKGTDFDQSGLSGLYARLGIQTIIAKAYHAQSKTVERLFGVFSELEEYSPTGTGPNINEKPPWRNRGEKLHKKVHEKIMAGRCVTMSMAHQAIAGWFEEFVTRPSHGKRLRGYTPAEIFFPGQGSGVDIGKLDYLMMDEVIKKVYRNGIHLPHHAYPYYSDLLYGVTYEVVIRYDLHDTSYIIVEDPVDGAVFRAYSVDPLHPAAKLSENEEDRKLLKQRAEMKNSQKKHVEAQFEAIADIIIPEQQRQLELLEGGDDVTGYAASVALPTEQVPEELPENVVSVNPVFESGWERFDWLIARAEHRKWTSDEAEWVEWYKTTSEFESVYKNKNE
ncbi:MAG: hypothetical protein GY749_02255 [Desulfobacteraceae bacterium]|nr:hypothetical protein [Desulfobacteraceae bacterium]